MLGVDSTDEIVKKSSRLKLRDYRHHPRSAHEQLEQLCSTLERRTAVVPHSLQPLMAILQTSISAIDSSTLWKSAKGKTSDQQKLARVICRLFVGLCQFDAECAASEQGGTVIIRSILQWLREDTDFHLIRSIK